MSSQNEEYYFVTLNTELKVFIDEYFPTEPCDDKPCFGENPATCMNEGTLCVCKGTLIDDRAGNCVGKSKYTIIVNY